MHVERVSNCCRAALWCYLASPTESVPNACAGGTLDACAALLSRISVRQASRGTPCTACGGSVMMNDGPRALHSHKGYSGSAKQVAAPELVAFTARATRNCARARWRPRGTTCTAWRVVRMISGIAEKIFWGPSVYDSIKSLAIPYSTRTE